MSFSLTIQEEECILLYGYLKENEMTLSPELTAVLGKIETLVFDHLSISEVEALISGHQNSGGII